MDLSPIIEHLLTMEVAGRRVVFQGVSQTIVERFPAGTEVLLNLLPGGTDYAVIAYAATFDPAVMPGAFYVEGQQYGNRLYAGTANLWWVQNDVSMFIFIRQREPAYIRVRNQTNADQYYSGLVFFVSMRTEEDYKLVVQELKNLHIHGRYEAEAVSLLKMMVARPWGGR